MLLQEMGDRRRKEADPAAADDYFRQAARTKELVRALQDIVHKGRTALT